MKLELIRPSDLLNLEIETVNLRRHDDDPRGPLLVVEDAAQPARIIVRFPPQTTAEPAYFEATGIKPSLPPDPVHPDNLDKPPDPDAGRVGDDVTARRYPASLSTSIATVQNRYNLSDRSAVS